MKKRQRKKLINNSLIIANSDIIPEDFPLEDWIIWAKQGILFWNSTIEPGSKPPSTIPKKNIKAFKIIDLNYLTVIKE